MTTEVERMTAAVTAWGRARWPGCRVVRELVLGARRVDLVFVCERDLAGMELKSGADTLARLEGQMREYGRYVPEVWLAVAPRWLEDEAVDHWGRNLVSVSAAGDVTDRRPGQKPHRDELVCSRMLELLWRSEAASIAVRAGVIPVRVPKQFGRGKILKMLSRLLTGNEIIAEVCQELRARQLVGVGSDAPLRPVDTAPPRTYMRRT